MGETSTKTNVLPLEEDVYHFMLNEYERLEKAGERFDAEKNNTLVEQKASEKFQISREEAAIIYAKVESQMMKKALFQ